MATLLVSREFFYRTHKAGGVKLLILRVEQGAHRLPADPTKYAGLTRLDLVFMDTTSLYFEGAGGQTLGQHGFSKDHRPDLRQMILAVLIDGDGRPVCSEMWPGNTADVTSLIPVIDRLRRRFAIGQICIVADRGMISAETLAELETRELFYILGVRERSDKVVRELVLNDPGPFVPLVLGLDPGITKRRKESATAPRR
jgi:transposase